jgi:RimJ/RimL family protein N-acetyltransferase
VSGSGHTLSPVSTADGPDEATLLTAHLRGWLGAWPPRHAVDVVAAPVRDVPAWDDRITPLVGVGTPDHTLLSVSPGRADAVRRVAGPLDDDRVRTAIVRAVGAQGHVLGRGVFRWSTTVASADVLPDAGEWVSPADPRVPAWLRPFNYGRVLIAWDDDGAYGAGVGIKRHDDVGHELAVGTSEHLRGRGLARRLVAQAARQVLSEGNLPTYLHDPDNGPSARVADAAGFTDRGWSVYGLFLGRGSAEAPARVSRDAKFPAP